MRQMDLRAARIEWHYIHDGLRGWIAAKPSPHRSRQIVAFLNELARLRRLMADELFMRRAIANRDRARREAA